MMFSMKIIHQMKRIFFNLSLLIFYIKYTGSLSFLNNTNSKSFINWISSHKNLEKQIVIYCIKENKYYISTQDYTRFHEIPNKILAIELGFNILSPLVVPNGLEFVKDKPLPIPPINSNSKDLYISHQQEINYFNLLFQGDPILISSSIKLPRYNHSSWKNIAILQLKSNKYLLSLNTKFIIKQNLYSDFDGHNEIIIQNKYNYYEEDHRFFVLSSGDILICFTTTIEPKSYFNINGTNQFIKGDIKVGLKVLKSTGNISNQSLSEPIILTFESSLHSNIMTIEKNWSPFQYLNKFYFVRTINPLHVIEVNGNYSKRITYFGHKNILVQYVTSVSYTDCLKSKTWSFGEYHGGTPAQLITPDKYLSFFYSRGKSSLFKSKTETYFLGAYMFTSIKPFKLIAISPRPITSSSFELNSSNEHLIVFPISYNLLDEFENIIPYVNHSTNISNQFKKWNYSTITIALSIGLNDVDNVILRMNLKVLMDSMRPIQC